MGKSNARWFYNILVEVVCFLFEFCVNMESEQNPLIVKYSSGSVKGSHATTNNGRAILSFRGIPYALPPLGDLRFKRSSPAGSQHNVINGTKESKKCLQLNALFQSHIDRNANCPFSKGSEDCLYLNVYSIPKKENLPVVVFFHGGAFIIGLFCFCFWDMGH